MGAAGVIIQSKPKQTQRDGDTAVSVAASATLEGSVVSWVNGSTDTKIAAAVAKAALDVLNAPAVIA